MNDGHLQDLQGDAKLAGEGVMSELPSTRSKDLLDRTIDLFERVMPDLSMLGFMLLLFMFYLLATGSNFGASADVFAAQRESAEAALSSPVYAPF